VFELLGEGLALTGDQGVFADPMVGLPPRDAMLLGQAHQLFARPLHQFGVGGMRPGLGLWCRRSPWKNQRAWPCRFGGDRQAFLDQRDERLVYEFDLKSLI